MSINIYTMEQVEMNNMYINIDVNNSSEKCAEKTPRLLVKVRDGSLIHQDCGLTCTVEI